MSYVMYKIFLFSLGHFATENGKRSPDPFGMMGIIFQISHLHLASVCVRLVVLVVWQTVLMAL
jgi:hypothetical protein